MKTNFAWTTPAAALLALTIAAPAAQASTYNLSVYQGDICGDCSNADAVTSSAPTFTNSNFPTKVLTGTYTSSNGSLNFNEQSGTNSIAAFLNTGTGGSASYSLSPSGALSNTLSTATTGSGTGTQTAFFFTGLSLSGPQTITITHDDGIAFYLGSVLMSPSGDEGPTTSETTTFSITAPELAADGSAFELVYVESNGLPAVLEMTVSTTPLPASIWLLGAALGGLGLMYRRRNSVPALAV